MVSSYTRDLTCLHTDDSGVCWYINTEGGLQTYDKLQSAVGLRSGVYRVLGCPTNYRLITELYSRLSRQEADAKVYVASPRVGKGKKATAAEALSCISVLHVHDSLSQHWHAVTSTSFNNYLLLSSFKEEGFTDLVTTVYGHHCLSKHFEFIGVPFMFAMQLIYLIVDPRWFLSTTRPARMQSVEAYFGLTPAAFRKSWDAGVSKKYSKASVRSAFLLDAVSHIDSDSFIHTRTAGIKDETERVRQACKLMLGYIVRNWLEELGLPGYFDADKFFINQVYRQEYQYKFRKT